MLLLPTFVGTVGLRLNARCPTSIPLVSRRSSIVLKRNVTGETKMSVDVHADDQHRRHSTLICTSLTGNTAASQLGQANEATRAGADLLEIRVDLLKDSETNGWERILQESPLPTIVTNRAAWEGGSCKLTEMHRLNILLRAVQLGAEHIDVELRSIPLFLQCVRSHGLSLPFRCTKLIVSYHDFENSLSSSRIDHLLTEMRNAGASVCKIAMRATSAMDNCIVFHALQKSELPSIILAMGEMGQPSRILAPKFRSYLTFASVGVGCESAPGQISTSMLCELYRFHSISSSTPAYGVIGNPIKHSMSPALHNAAMTVRDINGVFVAFQVVDEYPKFIRSMCDLGFKGFSVTIPAKVKAIDAMDSLDDVARKIGAMNTVVTQPDGSLKGYNTDWIAAISAVEDHLEAGMTGRHVVCIGAGGAGRGLAFGALERGAAHVIVVNRTKQKATVLADELGEKASAMSLIEFNNSNEHYDVLMNSTSVGMHPLEEQMPVNSERLIEGTVVFDAVYNPLKTKLLKEAEKKGCVPVSGVEMFVRQAAEQFRLWFPTTEAPVDKMRSVVLEKLTTS